MNREIVELSARAEARADPRCAPGVHRRTVTHQANERTILAWIRTGIALMAFGFAIARFSVFLRQVAAIGSVSLHGSTSFGSARIGAALVALGMLANLLARVRYAR